MTKNSKNTLQPVTTYVTPEAKKRWEEHIQKMRPRYMSVSQFLENAAELQILVDGPTYGPTMLLKSVVNFIKEEAV